MGVVAPSSKKGKVKLWIWDPIILEEEQKIVRIGGLDILMPSVREFPEFEAKIIAGGEVWLLKQNGKEYAECTSRRVKYVVGQLGEFFEKGKTGLNYSNDKLVWRLLRDLEDRKTGRRITARVLRKIIGLLKEGKRNEVKVMLLTREL